MQILLANAKIMFDKTDRKPVSTPLFQTVADTLAAEMARMGVEDLARQLDCSRKIASSSWRTPFKALCLPFSRLSAAGRSCPTRKLTNCRK